MVRSQPEVYRKKGGRGGRKELIQKTEDVTFRRWSLDEGSGASMKEVEPRQRRWSFDEGGGALMKEVESQ